MEDDDTPFKRRLDGFLKTIGDMLKTKNASYGDSALNPIRIFSKCDANEGIRVRIDDKLSRIARGNSELDEDTITDLIGYLVLLKIGNNLDE